MSLLIRGLPRYLFFSFLLPSAAELRYTARFSSRVSYTPFDPRLFRIGRYRGIYGSTIPRASRASIGLASALIKVTFR